MSATVPQPVDIVKLPLSAGSVNTVLVGKKPHIVFRYAVESIGLSFSRQLKKVKARSWANCGLTATVAEDGKIREMVTVDVKTFLMWLATVNELKVMDEVRPILIAYQAETTDVVDAYWTRGGAINPRATQDQLDELSARIADQDAQIRELTPDAHMYRVMTGREFSYDMRTVANILNNDPQINTGRTRLFRKLRDMGILDGRNKPVAKKAKYATEAIDELVKADPYRDFIDPRTLAVRRGGSQTLLTVKGLKRMHKELGGTMPLDITVNTENGA